MKRRLLLISLLATGWLFFGGPLIQEAQAAIDWSSCRTEGGTTTIPASSDSSTVTLSTAITDTGKAFLLVDSSGTSGIRQGDQHMVSGYILNSTTLIFQRHAAPATDAQVSYTLIECFNDEFSVQRGGITIPTSTTSRTVAITSVDTTRSIVIVNSRTEDIDYAEDEALVTGELQDATTVLVERAVAGAYTTYVRYEVVSFSTESSVSIQTGEVTLASGSASATGTLTTAVTTGNSWLYCSWDASNIGLKQSAVGCELTNGTTVTFYRYTAETYTNRIRYYVLEFPSGSSDSVQRGTAFDAANSADGSLYNDDITITAVSSITKAFPFVTNTVNGAGTYFPRNRWIKSLLSTTTLRTTFWAGDGGGAAADNYKYWQVVEFPTASVPSAPTLYYTGGADQLSFNNVKQNTTTPRFRVSATHTASIDTFQIELNDQADFAGTAYTQTFSGTYTSGTEYNMLCNALSPGLPVTDGATYYVRARASANGGSNWGDWSSGTWSFTYNAAAQDPMWFQTADEQFDTGTLANTGADGSDEVQVYAGTSGTIVSPAFEYASVTAAEWWNEFLFTDVETGGSITYDVEYWTGAAWADTPIVNQSTSPVDLSSLDPATYDQLRIEATLTSTAGAWYSGDYRKKITIDSTKVPNTNQLNFPVLINTTDIAWKDTANGGKVAQSDGGDIVFTSSDGITKLSHEIEKYDPLTGELVAWVKVPTVSATTDTDIYIYYGNAYASDQWDVNGTWDSNFKMVQHLEETSGTHSDSTSNGNNCTAESYTTQNASGKINGADSFPDPATNPAEIDCGSASSVEITGAITLETWMNMTATPTTSLWQDVVAKSSDQYTLSFKNTANLVPLAMVRTGGTLYQLSSGYTISTGTWYYLAMTYTSGDWKIYVKGPGVDQVTTDTTTTGALDSDVRSLMIGGHYSVTTNGYFYGFVDEARISNSVRTADWIATSYNNQNSPGTFYTVATEETAPALYLQDWTITTFGPTIVDLVSFDAIGYFGKVSVRWTTDSEIDNAGFNIYRSLDPDGGYIKINSDLIPGLGSSAMGKEYEFRDNDVTDGLTYYYKLEDVEFDGASTMHGPVEAHPGLDSDGDGMTDDWEYYYGLNPDDPADAWFDLDSDGLINLEESIQETDPAVPDIPDIPEPPGGEDGVNIIQSDDYGVILELITSSFEIETKFAGDETYHLIKLPYLHGQTTETGKPQIPVKGVLLGVPFNSSITINAVGYEEEILSGYNLYPTQRIHPDKGFPEGQVLRAGTLDQLSYKFVKNTHTYSQNRFYPDSLAEVSSVGSLRRQDVAKLNLYPVQFNPVTGELRFYKRIRIEVNFGDKAEIDLENTHKLPAPYKKLYKGLLHNYEDVKSWKRRPGRYKGPPRFIRGQAYKISVNEEGIYRLTWQDLYDIGLKLNRLNPGKIKIYNQGKQIPIYVAGGKDGRFDYGDYIEFYGEAIHNRYTSTNIYWLTTDGRQGLRMRIKPPFSGTGQTPASFLSDIRQEKDEMYWMDIPDKGYVDDHWFFGDSLWAPGSVDFTIPLSAVAAVQEEAMVEIALQGISYGFSDPDHHTRIYLNGYLIDDTTWDGDIEYIRQLNVPQSFLVEGDNTITIELPGDTGAEFDFILTNWFEISYWRQLKAKGNSLEFNNQGQGLYSYTISNFTEDDIEIFDVTDPEKVRRIVYFDIEEEGSTYNVSFSDRFIKQRNRNYIVLSSSGIKKPTSIVKDKRSNLRFKGNQADYIIITPEDFYDGILPLAEHRTAQGLNVKVVKVQDIYDEFNYGIFSPEAIKTFLKYAYSEWMEPAPTYVLLVGDGTYDYQDNEGLDSRNYVPTYMVHSLDFGETGSDNWFVCLDGEDDILPDMFIGRFPVYSVEQLNTLVDKTINYESASSDDWTKEVTLVADNLEGSFEAMSDSLIDYLPFEYQSNKIYLNDYSEPAVCKADIIDAINRGTLILNYAGHGSVIRWAHESILTISDIPYLTNLDKLTFISAMTCANGYFVYPSGYFNSIAEELLYSPSGGVVAILAPTGISYPNNQKLLDEGLFESIFVGDNFLIGPATAQAKLRVFENAGESGENVIRTFLLFGDPALELKR